MFLAFPVTGDCPRTSQGTFLVEVPSVVHGVNESLGVCADFFSFPLANPAANQLFTPAGNLRGGAPRGVLVSRARAVFSDFRFQTRV